MIQSSGKPCLSPHLRGDIRRSQHNTRESSICHQEGWSLCYGPSLRTQKYGFFHRESLSWMKLFHITSMDDTWTSRYRVSSSAWTTMAMIIWVTEIISAMHLLKLVKCVKQKLWEILSNFEISFEIPQHTSGNVGVDGSRKDIRSGSLRCRSRIQE